MAGIQNNFQEYLCLNKTFFVNYERLKNEVCLLIMFRLITDWLFIEILFTNNSY